MMYGFSYSFVGVDKLHFSGGAPGTERNNPYLAVAYLMWPGARENTGWQGVLLVLCVGGVFDSISACQRF